MSTLLASFPYLSEMAIRLLFDSAYLCISCKNRKLLVGRLSPCSDWSAPIGLSGHRPPLHISSAGVFVTRDANCQLNMEKRPEDSLLSRTSRQPHRLRLRILLRNRTWKKWRRKTTMMKNSRKCLIISLMTN